MKTKTRLVVAGAALAALTAAGAGTAAYAHHAFAAEFDANRPVLLKGAVEFVEWTNPHTWIHIKVKDVNKYGQPKAGSTLNWAIEGGTPNTIFRLPDAGKGMSAADQAKARRSPSRKAPKSSSAATSRKTPSARANGARALL